MGIRVILAAAILFVAVCIPGEANSATALDPAVVKVQSAEMCTGFAVDSSTIITAKHCLGGSVGLTQPETGWHCETFNYYVSPDSDWGVIKGCSAPASYPKGTWGVESVGYSLFSQNKQTRVYGSYYSNEGPYIRTDQKTQMGFSGSYILYNGELIGQIWGKCADTTCAVGNPIGSIKLAPSVPAKKYSVKIPFAIN